MRQLTEWPDDGQHLLPGAADSLAARHHDLLEALVTHPWVTSVADGTLSEQAFLDWVGQRAFFATQLSRAISILRAREMPSAVKSILGQMLSDDGRRQSELLVQTLTSSGVPTPGQPWPVCLGYSSYVVAVAAATGGIAEGICLIYAIELACAKTWTAARETAEPMSRWLSWLDYAARPESGSVAARLGQCLDTETGLSPSAEARGRLSQVFRTVLLWELAFCEMCWTCQNWPSITANR